MADQKSGEKKHRPRRPSNRRPSQNKTNKKAQGKNTNPNAKKSSNNKRRRRKPQGPKLYGIDLIMSKYNNLLEQYLNSRKKFHDLFYRADPRQKAKLERVYEQQTKNLREFESKLTDDDKSLFAKHNNCSKTDLAYSKDHDLEENTCSVSNDEIIDPHYLTTQIESDYSNDTEESMGSLDDYKNYKGQ
jgi:hypothetical protein